MSYIINGVEVKVGQVWESKSGHRFVVEDVNCTYDGESYPILLQEIDNCGARIGRFTRTAKGYVVPGEPENARNMFKTVQYVINQFKEQSMQNQIAQIPNLQIEDLRKTAEEPQYKTWGDLPDGTFVLDEFGDVYVVNKHHNSAAYCLDGGRVYAKASPYSSKNKIIKVKLQILE